MKKLPLGTRARLSDVGRDRYHNDKYNPHDQVGTVYQNDYNGDDADGMCYRVEWSNGETNCYYRSDLKVLPKLEENE